MSEEQEPEELTETQLNVIVGLIWVVFTAFVVLTFFYPYLAVGYLVFRWGALALKNKVWSAKYGE